jgi:hypothetical protein
MQQDYRCPNCGESISPGDRFCGDCGTELDWASKNPDDPLQSQFAEYQREQFAESGEFVTEGVKIHNRKTSSPSKHHTWKKITTALFSEKKKAGILLLSLAAVILFIVATVVYGGQGGSHIPGGDGVVTTTPAENPEAPKGPLPVVKSIKASPSVIPSGEKATLSWEVSGADTVSLDNDIGDVPAKGTKDVYPDKTIKYTLTATNGNGSSTSGVIVTVNPNAPVVKSFTASPSTIAAGQTATLKWEVSGANTINLQGVGNVEGSGSQVVKPAATTSYTLTATNSAGVITAQATVTISSSSVPVITSFTATSENISEGASTTLEWYVSNATSVSIDHDVGEVSNTMGSKVVYPSATAVYTLAATNAAGTNTSSITINVASTNLPKINEFYASPTNIQRGSSSTLHWSVTGATTVYISNIGNVAASGSQQVSPTSNTPYILTATNDNGPITRTVTVYVGTITLPVIISFTASPPTISAGDSSTLSWNITGADSISLDKGIGTPPGFMPLSYEVTPPSTTTYTLTATNSAGPVIRTVTVTVTP